MADTKDTAVSNSDSHPKVLYRKYRPTKLSDVVGQEQITQTLATAIKQGKIAHAYLFIGPRGTGKTSVARILAHAINNFDYQVEDNYLDIIEIDAASNTGVDNIRELREKAIIAPTKGRYKVYIIDEIHMLTKSASNALLKTLEEPPEHVVFIMATTDAHKVPITIASRTQVHTFRLADPKTMQRHLRQISDNEGIKITDEALQVVVKRGGGSFRDSLSLLDQIANLTDQEITAELLNSSLGLPAEQIIQQLLSAYSQHDNNTITSTLKDLLNSGLQPEILAAELVDTIVNEPQSTFLPLLEKLPNVMPPFSEAKLLLALLDNGSVAQQASAAPSTPVGTPQVQTTNQATTQTATPTSPISTPSEPIKPEPIRPASTTPKPKPTPKITRPAIPVNHQSAANTVTDTSNDITSAASLTFDQRSMRPFTWEDFLETVHNENIAVYGQLMKVRHDFKDNILHLYPEQKFVHSILEKSGNLAIMNNCLPTGVTLQLHDFDEKPTTKDPTLSQISAIMGDVQEVSSDSPF